MRCSFRTSGRLLIRVEVGGFQMGHFRFQNKTLDKGHASTRYTVDIIFICPVEWQLVA